MEVERSAYAYYKINSVIKNGSTKRDEKTKIEVQRGKKRHPPNLQKSREVTKELL